MNTHQHIKTQYGDISGTRILRNICFVLALFSVGCSNAITSSNDILNGFEIIDTASIHIDCLWINDLGDHYLIRDSLAYQSLLQYTVREYDSCVLPPINFNKYSLVGCKTITGGCIASLPVRKIILDTASKLLSFSILWKTCGDCQKEYSDMNWMRIPKVGPDYRVDYEIQLPHISSTLDSCR